MSYRISLRAFYVLAALIPVPIPAQEPAIQSTVDEVMLDLTVRDKKGKPVSDLKADDVVVFDNGVRQKLNSFRLVSGTTEKLEPLRQMRLVTLAFENLSEADARKLARTAALDLVKSEQDNNVFFAVAVINTRLLMVQQFSNDHEALAKAIERATGGLAVGKFLPESERIAAGMKRNLEGPEPQRTLARVTLDMLNYEEGAVAQGTRLSLAALKGLVHGLQDVPGRKSVLYFSQGMYLPTELETMFANVLSMANRANVTFYPVDTRGVMTFSQNAGATAQLNGATDASATTVLRDGGGVTKDEVLSSDRAETSGRNNTQLPIRDLADATGGFLIGDSNDLRGPLHRIDEEIDSYYEVTFNPGIQKYDGSFRKLKVELNRKDAVVRARSGYFALPPEARDAGLQNFEMPLLKALAAGKVSDEVAFRARAVLLQPKEDGTDLSVLVEVPLSGLQPKTDGDKGTLMVHCAIGALVKNAQGEVVQKLTRDRSFRVTSEQLKAGNFLEKMEVTLPVGKYTIDSAVTDLDSGKTGVQHSDFSIAPRTKGVAISSLTQMRSYTPNVKGLDPNEPFQFQGGSITPTLNPSVVKAPEAMLRLFFTIYQDPSISAKPSGEIEFMQNGKSLQKAPLPLPAADARGRIPYVMTIPAASIPAGIYEIRATAHQGDSACSSETVVKIEAL